MKEIMKFLHESSFEVVNEKEMFEMIDVLDKYKIDHTFLKISYAYPTNISYNDKNKLTFLRKMTNIQYSDFKNKFIKKLRKEKFKRII